VPSFAGAARWRLTARRYGAGAAHLLYDRIARAGYEVLGLSAADLFLAGPSLITVAYGVLGYANARSHPVELVRLSEELYFLGYLATVASLVAWAVHSSQSAAGISDVSAILRALGVAMSATLFGLVAMPYLKRRAQSIEDGLTQMPPEQQLLLIAEANSVITKLSRLATAAEAATHNLGSLTSRLDGVSTEVAAFGERVQAGQSDLNQFVEGTRRLQNSMIQISSCHISEQSLQSLTRGVESLGGLAAQADTLRGLLAEMSERVRFVSTSCEEFGHPLRAGGEEAKRFRQEVNELSQVLDSYAELMANKILDSSARVAPVVRSHAASESANRPARADASARTGKVERPLS
jgi:hypothetical protein